MTYYLNIRFTQFFGNSMNIIVIYNSQQFQPVLMPAGDLYARCHLPGITCHLSIMAEIIIPLQPEEGGDTFTTFEIHNCLPDLISGIQPIGIYQALNHSNKCLTRIGNTCKQRYKGLGIRPQYTHVGILPKWGCLQEGKMTRKGMTNMLLSCPGDSRSNISLTKIPEH